MDFFTPLKLGEWTLPIRIIMAPLTRCRASEGRVPNDLMARYYAERASAGLILSEATCISPLAVGYPDTPGIWSEAQIAGWQKITQAVHDQGGRIICQLWHVGRISHPDLLGGEQPVSASAVTPKGDVNLLRPKRAYVQPRALERSEIPDLIATYAQAARNAQRAGFDGVEIHAANGYLPDQFLQDRTNQRTDDYGGSIANRARLTLEITDAAIAVWGAQRVGVHLSPRGDANDMGDSDPLALFSHVVRELNQRRIAFIFVREVLQGNSAPLRAQLRKLFTKGVTIANERLTRESALAVLQSGEADAVAFGQLFIANPDLPERLRRNAPLNTPNPATFYGPLVQNKTQGYTDYPALAA